MGQKNRNWYFSFFKSKALAQAVANVPNNILTLSQEKLERKFKPSTVDLKLRRQFWHLIGTIPESVNHLKLRQIYTGICTYTNFYNHFLTNPVKVAWLLSPNESVKSEIRAAQDRALSNLRDLVTARVIDDRGRINIRAANKLLQSVEILFAIQSNRKIR